MTFIKAILLIPLVVFANLALADSDSGYTGRPYGEIVQEMRELAQSYPKLADVITYGKTPKGLDMVAIRLREVSTSGFNAPLMVITGAIHGDEFLGIEDRFARWVLETGISSEPIQKFFAMGGEMVFIPVMNPDGYTRDERENSKGVDLNRDFELKLTGHPASTQMETKAYTAFLKNELVTTGRNLRFTLDYHCCIGATLVPWAYGKSVPLSTKDQARYELVGFLSKDILGVEAGTPWNILGYTADGSTMDYMMENYGTTAIAYEGARRKENQYLDKHTAFLESVVRNVNDGRL